MLVDTFWVCFCAILYLHLCLCECVMCVIIRVCGLCVRGEGSEGTCVDECVNISIHRFVYGVHTSHKHANQNKDSAYKVLRTKSV